MSPEAERVHQRYLDLLDEIEARFDVAGWRCGDVDLWQRELTVRGKGGKDRIVKIGHQAAISLDRYLRVRSRHAQAWRPQLWHGPATGNR